MNRTKSVIALLGIAGLASFTPAANAITILDVFNGPQSASITPGPASTTFTDPNPANILGGTRTLTVGQVAGIGNISSSINAGTLLFNSDFGTDGFLTLGYSTPAFDITPGANGLTGQLAGDLGGANFTLTLTSPGGSSSASQLIVPSGTAGTFSGFNIPFSSLTGTVDLTQVTGVTLRLDGTNSFDGALRLLQFSTPPGDVPEPGSVALLIGGALSGAVVLRRRRK